MKKDLCYSRSLKTKKPKLTYNYESVNRSNEPIDIEKLNKIIVPATYTKVIICPDRDRQATGYDSTGRKQYFYSREYVKKTSREKYCNLRELGDNLEEINRDIDALLEKGLSRALDQDVIDALALRIMILCNFRVGNRKNLKKYGTYGLSTLTRDHLKINGDQAHIKFIGKKKQINECLVDDPDIVQFLKILAENREKLDKNSAQPLFKLNGYCVTPSSLNNFLSRYSKEITTKTWRTLYANLGYLEKMTELAIPKTKNERKRLSNEVIKEMAEELHHTPAINKRSYLLKELPETYIERPDEWVRMTRGNNYNEIFGNFLHSYCE